MTICIIGNGLSALALAKTLVNQNIYVDLLVKKKNLKVGGFKCRILKVCCTVCSL